MYVQKLGVHKHHVAGQGEFDCTETSSDSEHLLTMITHTWEASMGSSRHDVHTELKSYEVGQGACV